jgi:RHS repeat-associated protein
MLRSGTVSYYEADGLGSITSMSNSSGQLTQTYTYDSFGGITASTGSLVNPFRFTGREFDSETGLYFYRARYYDPAAGRFLSEDPIEFRGGVNFYRYVSNGPTNLTDPLGLGPGVIPWPWPWPAIPGKPLGDALSKVIGATGRVIGVGGRALGVGVTVVLDLTIFAPAFGDEEAKYLPRPKPCDPDKKVLCYLNGEYKDPSFDPKFKMCSYTCSDGSVRVWVIHISLPCPPTADRLSQ